MTYPRTGSDWASNQEIAQDRRANTPCPNCRGEQCTIEEPCETDDAETATQMLGTMAALPPPSLEPQPLRVVGICERISAHALSRYRERTGLKKSDASVINRIRERIERADEWKLKERFRLIELLAHGGQSRFFKDRDMLFVIENETVITCHHGQADRWEPINKPVTGIPATGQTVSCDTTTELPPDRED